MATTKKAPTKKSAKAKTLKHTPPKKDTPPVETIEGITEPTGQAWESGIGFDCARDESDDDRPE